MGEKGQVLAILVVKDQTLIVDMTTEPALEEQMVGMMTEPAMEEQMVGMMAEPAMEEQMVGMT